MVGGRKRGRAPRMNQQAQTNEAVVLQRTASVLRDAAGDLPRASPWVDVLNGVAEGFEAGAELSRLRDRHAV
jgi:hypothetical protein